MEYHEINSCFKVSTDYNGDLIQVFYVGLELRQWCIFLFQMGKNSYHFMENTWKDVFGLLRFSHFVTRYDYSFHPNFDLRSYLNSCLKAPRSEDNLAKTSKGCLNRNMYILHWIVTHVLCPRKGGHSRIDIVEVHMMYLL